jgi:hypothetical protein
MGRKRLMTILAGVIAAVGLHVGPAAALDVGLPGVGDVTVESSDGLQLEADLDLGDDAVKLDPKVEAEVSSEPKLEVEGGATVGDESLDLGEATEPLQDAVNDPGGSSPAPTPEPSPSEDPADGSSDGSSKHDDAPVPAEDREASGTGDDQVTTAGRTEPLTPERAAQIEAFRAMRDANASSFGHADYDGRVIPGVQLAPRSAPVDDTFAIDPEVAPGVEVAAPSVADEQERSAQLAATPFSGTMPDVPVALQLLAGTLVAGAALAWHLARRELAAAPIVKRSTS